MTSTDNTIYVKTKTNRMNKITKLHSLHLKFTLQINHRYLLLYWKGHIQMMSNDSKINVVTKNHIVNKMIKLYLINLELTLQHITFTNYYIAKDTFKQWVMTTALMQRQKNRVNKMVKFVFNTHRIYITIYHTYTLFYCREKI